MGIPQRKTVPTDNPSFEWVITDDDSRTLRNVRLDESYHSGCGAILETWHVYLVNSGVQYRLAHHQPTSVLEYGFGTGTGFLLSAALAEYYGSPLQYVGLENNVLPAQWLLELQLEQCLEAALSKFGRQIPTLQRITKRLSQGLYELLASPTHSCVAEDLTPNVRFSLWTGDAVKFDSGQCRAWKGPCVFDAIYFDPFSPSTNPELWTPPVFQQAGSMLSTGGRLVSYCVKSSVQRDLSSIGLRVECVSGPPGGKREVLRATKVTGTES